MKVRENADYIVMQCINCGMLNVVHNNRTDGSRCGARRCAMQPVGYAILARTKGSDVFVKVNVNNPDLDKVQELVNEIDATVSSIVKNLTVAKGLMQHDGENI